jgi:predicted RNA-binding Zn-ribbon protein involved in translation (DUF1610 family)
MTEIPVAGGAYVVCPACGGEVPIAMAAARSPERPFRCDSCMARGSEAARQFILHSDAEAENAIIRLANNYGPDDAPAPGVAPSRARAAKRQPRAAVPNPDGPGDAGDSGIDRQEHEGQS